MRMFTSIVVAALSTTFCDGRPTASGGRRETLDAFLNRVERLISSRNPEGILALADRTAGRDAGKGAPEPAMMALPRQDGTAAMAPA